MWLGLENFSQMTKRKNYHLRIKLTDDDGIEGVGYWESIHIGDEVSFTSFAYILISYNAMSVTHTDFRALNTNLMLGTTWARLTATLKSK
jgi:hypothetical protein